MGEITPKTPPLLSQAIVVWTGRGRTAWPSRDERYVVEQFGEDVAVTLMPAIKELAADFYLSSARDTVADLSEMGDVAASEFRSRHPEISEEAVQALRWCYTYDYK